MRLSALYRWLRKPVYFVVVEPDELVCRVHRTGRVESRVSYSPLRTIESNLGREHRCDAIVPAGHGRKGNSRIGVVDVRMTLLKRSLSHRLRGGGLLQPAQINRALIEAGEDRFRLILVDRVSGEQLE